MKETGLRNGAHGADKFGFKDLAGVHWNLPDTMLYEHAIAQRRRLTSSQGGALCAETGHHTGRSPKDKHTVVDATTENTVWWDGNRKQSHEQFDNLLARFPRPRQGQDAVRAGPLRRRRSAIPHQGARLHRARLALAVHPPAADPPRARRARRLRAGHDHRRPAVVQGGRQAPRRPRRLRHHGRDRLHPQDRADRRLVLCRRDEEVGLHRRSTSICRRRA